MYYMCYVIEVSTYYTPILCQCLILTCHNDKCAEYKLVKGKLRHVEHFKCLSEKKIYYKWAALNWKLLGKLHEKELGEKRF